MADDSGCVWINDEQHFTGVDEQMDSFSVGGIRIVSQWLSDRRGRVLSTDDVHLFMSVLGAISRLTEIPTEVDEVIEKHGWPLL